MKGTIVGVKVNKGVNKNQQPYHNANVFVTHRQFGVSGLATTMLFIKNDHFPVDSLEVGMECDFSTDRGGWLTDFDVTG